MSKYRISTDPITNTVSILDTDTNGWIPQDEANTDYQAYLAWLADGNTPEPWGAE